MAGSEMLTSSEAAQKSMAKAWTLRQLSARYQLQQVFGGTAADIMKEDYYPAMQMVEAILEANLLLWINGC
jgi:hypothetical protein